MKKKTKTVYMRENEWMDGNRLFMFNVSFSFKFDLMKWRTYENEKKKTTENAKEEINNRDTFSYEK